MLQKLLGLLIPVCGSSDGRGNAGVPMIEKHDTEVEPKERIHSLWGFKTPGLTMTDAERKLVQAGLDDREGLEIDTP